MGDTPQTADLLSGARAIGQFLGMTERRARYLAETGSMPTFKIGGLLCARRSTLVAWLEQAEAAGRKPLPEASGDGPEGGAA